MKNRIVTQFCVTRGEVCSQLRPWDASSGSCSCPWQFNNAEGDSLDPRSSELTHPRARSLLESRSTGCVFFYLFYFFPGKREIISNPPRKKGTKTTHKKNEGNGARGGLKERILLPSGLVLPKIANYASLIAGYTWRF